MKKQLLIIGIIVLLVVVGLSGCSQLNSNSATNSNSDNKDISDIPKGNNQLQIVNYNLLKSRELMINYTSVVISESDSSSKTYTGETPIQILWTGDINDIKTNFDKRKKICTEYIGPGLGYDIVWDSDYNGLSIINYGYQIHWSLNDFRLSNKVSYWIVNGTVKNIGNIYLNRFKVTVNFYNNQGVLIAYESSNGFDLPSGYAWDFYVKYDGKYTDDVNHVDFKLDTS